MLTVTDTAKLSLYLQLWLVSPLPSRVTPQCSLRSLPTNEITTIRSSIGRIAHYNWNCKNTVISHTHYNSFRTGYLQYFFQQCCMWVSNFPVIVFKKIVAVSVVIVRSLRSPSHQIYLTEPHFRHWRRKLLYIAGNARHTALDYVAAKHVSQYIMIVIAVTIRMVITPKVAARALYMSAQRESRCASSKSPRKIQNTILIWVQNFLLFFMFH